MLRRVKKHTKTTQLFNVNLRFCFRKCPQFQSQITRKMLSRLSSLRWLSSQSLLFLIFCISFLFFFFSAYLQITKQSAASAQVHYSHINLKTSSIRPYLKKTQSFKTNKIHEKAKNRLKFLQNLRYELQKLFLTTWHWLFH